MSEPSIAVRRAGVRFRRASVMLLSAVSLVDSACSQDNSPVSPGEPALLAGAADSSVPAAGASGATSVAGGAQPLSEPLAGGTTGGGPMPSPALTAGSQVTGGTETSGGGGTAAGGAPPEDAAGAPGAMNGLPDSGTPVSAPPEDAGKPALPDVPSPPRDPSLERAGESQIALSGLTVVSYGGYLNGESFQQDGLISHNGYQYSAFWNTNRNVVLTRRRLPDGEWEKFDLTDYRNSADDAHNTISLGISPDDGTLHLAFDHHGDTLHYRRSNPGVVSEPEAALWDASSFGAVTSSLEAGPVALVTYPRFITEPGGARLLLAMRIGSSGSGDELLWEYDSTSGEWSALGKMIDGTSDSVNAYLHGFAYTRGGERLHAAWCWRDTPDAKTNHDLFYVYSDDHGRSWMNNAGEQIGLTGSQFITQRSSGALVQSIGQNRGLINQEHMTVDGAGRVHVLLSHMPDAEPDDGDFTRARTKSEFFHYFRDVDGSWTRREIGLRVVENFRGTLAVSSSNNLYAVLPNLRIAAASATKLYADWTLLEERDPGMFFSDPLVDARRLEQEDTLSIFYPQTQSPNVWAFDYTVQ